MNAKTIQIKALVAACAFLIYSCYYDSLPGGCADGVTVQVVRQDSSDCGLQNGELEVTLIGGTGNFHYQLNDGVRQDNPVFKGLAAGSYKITAISESNCEYSLSTSIENRNGVITTVMTAPSGCMTSNGSIMIAAKAGVPPYQFKFNNGIFSSTNSFSNLTSGNYQIITRDSTGCEFKQTVAVTSGIRYSEVLQLIQANCAINGCHKDVQFPKLQSYNDIHNNAQLILRQVNNRTMPPGKPLSQSQISTIACWINDGAQNN